jgi:hypothetical protein
LPQHDLGRAVPVRVEDHHRAMAPEGLARVWWRQLGQDDGPTVTVEPPRSNAAGALPTSGHSDFKYWTRSLFCGAVNPSAFRLS